MESLIDNEWFNVNYYVEGDLQYGTHYFHIPPEKGENYFETELYGAHFLSYVSVGVSLEVLKHR